MDDPADIPQHIVSTAGTRPPVVDDNALYAGHCRALGPWVAAVVELAGVGAAPVGAIRGAVVTGLARIDDAVYAPLDRAIRPAAVSARVVPVVACLAMVDHAVAARGQRAQEGRDVIDLVRGDLDSPDELAGR